MKLSIRDLDLKGKRLFLRVDFNVPLKGGVIGDDTRIRASLPTIKFALEKGATVVLASHLGRPKGKPNPDFSLRPIAARLAELLGQPVTFLDDCIGDDVKQAVDQGARLRPGRGAARKPSLPSRGGEERGRGSRRRSRRWPIST